MKASSTPLDSSVASVVQRRAQADANQAFNQACFCFSLDDAALAQALDSELGRPGLSDLVRKRCPYMFAARPVFVVAT